MVGSCSTERENGESRRLPEPVCRMPKRRVTHELQGQTKSWEEEAEQPLHLGKCRLGFPRTGSFVVGDSPPRPNQGP